MMIEVEVGDVVQIDPEYANQAFAGCFLVVTEIRSWGIQGYVPALGTFEGPDTREKRGTRGGLAFVRIPTDAFVRIGMSAWRITLDDAEGRNAGPANNTSLGSTEWPAPH